MHGGNRLGGNSLLDILVFGRASGLDMQQYLKEHRHHEQLNEASVEQAMERFHRWDQAGEGISVQQLSDEFRKVMEDHAGVFRTEEIMQEGLDRMQQIRDQLPNVRLKDQSRVFNTARVEAFELENMIQVGMSIMLSAYHRKESRGAHSRPDYPDRDDMNWLRHSLFFLQDDHMDYKPVRTKPLSVDSFPPKERVY